MTKHSDDAETDGVEWRRLDRRLWSASRHGRPLGTVERGSRYVALDVEGAVLGRYETLDTAMAALAAQDGDLPPQPGLARVLVERTAFTVTSAFGLGAVAVIGYAIAAGLFS